MGRLIDRNKRAALLGPLLGLLLALSGATVASAAEPYEFDPVLSLTGDCSALSGVDPVPDPSCTGTPPEYPPAPDRPKARFVEPRAIAVDPFGNEYVASWAESSDVNGRIDVFDDEGKFVTEVAAPNAKSVAVDSEGNLYVFEDTGQIVRYSPEDTSENPYEPEAGKIKYEDPPSTVSTGDFVGALAIDASNDRLVVAHRGTIFIYRSAAESEPNTLVEPGFEPKGEPIWTEAIAVDAQRRRIYTSFCNNDAAGTECGVLVIDADAHAILEEVEGPSGTEKFAVPNGRLGLAVDEETGDFFVADSIAAATLYQFDENFEYLSRVESDEFQTNIATQIAISNGNRSPSADPCEYPKPGTSPPAGQACNRHYLFVPALQKKGRALAYHPSNQMGPVIEGVSPEGIGETEAELRATIFPGGLDTEYSFQITTQEAWEAETEKFEDATTLSGGTIPANGLATEVSAFATNLVPGLAYRFRIVAENSLGEDEEEASFSTYDDALVSSDCPNQTLRVDLSAHLPDCRAYELVTPSDTNGRPPKGVGFVGNTFPTVLSSPAGDLLSFKIEGGSLPGSSGVGGFEGDPYVAKRGPSGWSSTLTGPTGEEATMTVPASVSPDQGYLFFTADREGPLVIDDEETQYIHYPDGRSELIGRGNEGQTDPLAKGTLITAGAQHIVFQTLKPGLTNAPVQLDPDAPPTGTSAVYDRTINPATKAEKTHVISLLPGDITPAAGKNAEYVGASKDGEGIAFSIGNALYLRVNNETSYKVGENVEFAGVSEGGDRIFYVEGGDLLALDTTSGDPEGEVVDFAATGNATPVNVSTDGTRAYFVSPTVLGGTNSEGDSAQAGEQNLYLSEEGAVAFVAMVTDRDVEGEDVNGSQIDGLGLWTEVTDQPARDPSRLNPDGSVLLFQSRANITGYEASEFPQIYRYDSAGNTLQCISCNPTKTPATGGASLEAFTLDSAAPPPLSPNGFVANLTPSGKRVFFESDEPLVSSDTDEVKDVYEWEEDGVGSCDRTSGCVYLISSGQSLHDNFLFAHSTNGDDVFFSTEDALTGFDNAGTASIYDAKVGGGFPNPVNPEPCVGDGCRPSITPSPSFPAPVAGGEGNVPHGAKKPGPCPKGKHKVKRAGKVRCVKKKQHKKQKGTGKAKKRAGANRGAGK